MWDLTSEKDNKDYVFFAGQSEVNEDFDTFFNRIIKQLKSYELYCSNFVQVTLKLEMDSFSAINRKYAKYFNHQPPVRVCIQPKEQAEKVISLTLFATRQVMEHLHVQSVSQWAPANIGPYSQAIRCGKFVFLAGQIGLDPGSMTLQTGIVNQYVQIKANFSAVLETFGMSLNNNASKVICYVSEHADFTQLQEAFE